MNLVTSTDELMSLMQEYPPPVLLDVRWRLLGPPAKQDYDQAHLPGARYVDLDTELAGPPGPGGRHPLPDPEALQRTFRKAGVDSERPVVVYDDGDASAAARAWWLLRWAGHQHVSVLDGGYAAWTAVGLPVTSEVPPRGEGDFRVRPGGMPVVDADTAASIARQGTLLDARAPERYRGESEPIDPRAGHVPGAVNAPFTAHTNELGSWRSPEDLARRFAQVDARQPLGVYCGSGVTACSVVLALEYAGVTSPRHPAALYAGSWSHWSSDPERPVATGAEPG